MKNKHFYQDKNQRPAGAARPAATGELNHNKIDSAPLTHEVADRAYFNYVNQGSSHGHDVRHWLEAEAQLRAERNPTPAGALPNRA